MGSISFSLRKIQKTCFRKPRSTITWIDPRPPWIRVSGWWSHRRCWWPSEARELTESLAQAVWGIARLLICIQSWWQDRVSDCHGAWYAIARWARRWRVDLTGLEFASHGPVTGLGWPIKDPPQGSVGRLGRLLSDRPIRPRDCIRWVVTGQGDWWGAAT